MIIIHRCTTCHHPDLWTPMDGHGRRIKCTASRCPCTQCTPGPSEAMPTYSITGRVIETCTCPGDNVRGIGASCGCPGCKKLFEQLTSETRTT